MWKYAETMRLRRSQSDQLNASELPRFEYHYGRESLAGRYARRYLRSNEMKNIVLSQYEKEIAFLEHI